MRPATSLGERDPQAPSLGGLAPTVLLVLGGLSAFAPLSTDMYLPGLPLMARDLGASSSAAQLTLSTCLVGLAVGQLLAGPLSDAFGRRRPLLVGLGCFVLASGVCAFASDIAVLLAMRFFQGLSGASGIAIARAIVRDRTHGAAAARTYALLMVVTGLGPILAPVAGGLLLHVTDWRGIFGVLALLGLLIMLTAVLFVPETLAPGRRTASGLTATRTSIGILLRDRRYLGHTFAGAFSSGTLMAYIAGSPFVLERIHHLSAQAFSLVFAVNGCGLLIARQLAAAAVRRLPPASVMRTGLICQATAAAGVLAATLLDSGVVALVACAFVAVGSVGAIMPMATALAMNEHPERAGSASGLLGFTQFTLASLVAPLVGSAGPLSALPLALVMPACACAGLIALRVTTRYRAPVTAPAPS